MSVDEDEQHRFLYSLQIESPQTAFSDSINSQGISAVGSTKSTEKIRSPVLQRESNNSQISALSSGYSHQHFLTFGGEVSSPSHVRIFFAFSFVST